MSQPSRSEIPESPRRPFLNLLLLTATLLLTFGLTEGVLRLALGAWPFEPEATPLPHLTEQDHLLRWRFTARDGRNSLGFRNREIGPKVAGTTRVLFLGDSLIWASDTSSEALWTEVVEKGLNGSETGVRVEAINAGVPGYTTFQELELLRRYGLAMEPDLVVLGFVFNDLHHPYAHRVSEEDTLAMLPEARRHRFDRASFPGSLLGRSYLAHEVVYRLQILGQRFTAAPEYSFLQRDDFYLAWKPYPWQRTEQLLVEIRDLLAGQGVRLAMLVFPIRDQMDAGYLASDREFVLYPQARINEIAERLQIPTLDLTAAVSGGGGAELFDDYLHFGPAGNDLVAREVEPFVARLLSDP